MLTIIEYVYLIICKCIAELIADNEINDFKIRRKRDKRKKGSKTGKQWKCFLHLNN